MEIHWAEMGEISEDEREAAEARLAQLEQGHSDLIDLRISGHQTRHHQHGAREVRLSCQARGKELIVARQKADLSMALNDVLDVFEREVHRMREKRRDRTRAPTAEPPCLGIVDRIFRDDGYGFILTDDGEQVYFHRNAVKKGLDFDRLAEADRVALDIEAGRDGPQATTVHAPPPGVA